MYPSTDLPQILIRELGRATGMLLHVLGFGILRLNKSTLQGKVAKIVI